MGKGDDVLWDDEAFRGRVEERCKKLGVPLHATLKAAGASRYYLNKPVDGRSTNTVMKLARQLDMKPSLLAFGDPEGPIFVPQQPGTKTAPDTIVREKERVLLIEAKEALEADLATMRKTMSQMFTARQVMSLVCVALNQGNANRESILALVMRAARGEDQDADGPSAAPSSSADGNGAK